MNICLLPNLAGTGILWSPADPIVYFHKQTAAHTLQLSLQEVTESVLSRGSTTSGPFLSWGWLGFRWHRGFSASFAASSTFSRFSWAYVTAARLVCLCTRACVSVCIHIYRSVTYIVSWLAVLLKLKGEVSVDKGRYLHHSNGLFVYAHANPPSYNAAFRLLNYRSWW